MLGPAHPPRRPLPRRRRGPWGRHARGVGRTAYQRAGGLPLHCNDQPQSLAASPNPPRRPRPFRCAGRVAVARPTGQRSPTSMTMPSHDGGLAADEALAQAWVDACHQPDVGHALTVDAAFDYLQAVEAACDSRRVKIAGIEGDDAFRAASRTLLWATGSPTAAVRQLVALRLLLDPSEHVVIDAAVIAIVSEAVTQLEH